MPLLCAVTAAVKKTAHSLCGTMTPGARGSHGGLVECSGEHDGLLLRAAAIRQMECMSHPADSQERRLFQMLGVLTAVLDAEHSGYNAAKTGRQKELFLLELLMARPLNIMFSRRKLDG